MFNLENHTAFDSLKKLKIINTIIDDLLTEKNFCYTKFNEKINEAAIGIADQLYPNNIAFYSSKNFSSKEDFENKIKGDIFEIFVMFFLQYFEKMPNVIGIKEGTYVQVPDDDDAGMDFYGIKFSSGKNERVFGQIKYRNPNINLQEEHKAFTRTVACKLIGIATLEKDFDQNKDILLFVSNRTIDDSIHYKFKNMINFINGSADSLHHYCKFIDANIFQNLLGFNEATFWLEFKNQFN